MLRKKGECGLKATGIVRRIDDLGRIVIAKELRKTLGINEGDPIEAFVEDDKVILRKYQPGCVFCGNVEHLWEHKGVQICQSCVDTLTKCARPEEVKANAEPRASKKA